MGKRRGHRASTLPPVDTRPLHLRVAVGIEYRGHDASKNHPDPVGWFHDHPPGGQSRLEATEGHDDGTGLRCNTLRCPLPRIGAMDRGGADSRANGGRAIAEDDICHRFSICLLLSIWVNRKAAVQLKNSTVSLSVTQSISLVFILPESNGIMRQPGRGLAKTC